MNTSTVSSKYQIVIPKELRQQLQIKPGQKVSLSISGDSLKVKPATPLEELAGKYSGVWGKDPDAYISELRDEWEDHQKRLDDLRK